MEKRTKLLLLGLSVVSLSACTSPFSAQSTVEGKYNLTIACQTEEGEKTVLSALKEAYEKEHPNVNIVLKDFGGSTFTEYMLKYASNQSGLPDIMWMPDDSFAAFAKGGYFLDLRPYYEASTDTAYDLYYNSMLHSANYFGNFKTYKEDPSADSGLYFAPRDYNKVTLCINRHLFEEVGVSVPDTSKGWTFQDLVTLTKDIYAKIEGKRIYSSYRVLYLHSQWEPVYSTLYPEIAAESSALFKEDTTPVDFSSYGGLINSTGDLLVKSTQNLRIMSYLYDNLFTNAGMIDTSDNFIRGTTFMTITVRPSCVAYAKTLKDATSGANYLDFLPFPATKVGAGCSGYGITNAHAEDVQTVEGVKKTTKEVAWDFIKYVITEKGQEVAGATGLGCPVLKSLAANGAWRKAIDPSLNHDAFLAGEELRLTSFNCFEPNKRTPLRSIVSAIFQNLESQTEGAPDKREAMLDKYIVEFNKKR